MSASSIAPSRASPLVGAAARPRERSSAVNLPRFAVLLAQLLALLAVFWGLNTENDKFLRLAQATIVAFVIHYFTPEKWKQWAFTALSLAGAMWVLADPVRQFTLKGYVPPALVVLVTLTVGMIFYAITRLPVGRAARVALVVAFGAFVAVWRAELWLGAPDHWFKFIGAIFMFRGILYTYEMYQARPGAREKLSDFLAYFFMLPNFYFLLFPVVDYATFKKSRNAGDIHATAQRGISWMVRGAVHLALYRLIYHRLPITPAEVDSFGTLLKFVFPTFLLYLQVSGQFHMAVGMLLLFGFRLPETNHRYLLSSSFTDFWRRINIYWKDFMVKVFYYPAYFRLRKTNETLALVVATVWVFIATTLLHGYQLFWLQRKFLVTSGDLIFWSVLGVLVLANVLWENRKGKVKKKAVGAGHRVLLALRILGVYLTISVLWSLWSSTSVALWFDTVMYWK